ncbi:hypothetical protein BIW11_03714 [Tropilaelaps mercedesae]|uniref:Uncharacterized protein n=1 Tax=Tropilaelaps mercedesae TaxID=418985 RepID=A0A1V9XHC0_9ACAR|nr:hypothetical protein BIW11_03714 [Tropilaelaps mercedesae]
MLYDGYYMNPNEGVDEYREIEKTLLNKDEQRLGDDLPR